MPTALSCTTVHDVCHDGSTGLEPDLSLQCPTDESVHSFCNREKERERGATVAALNFSDHIYIYRGLPIASLHKQRYLQHFPASSISKIPLKSTPATGLWTWNPTELLHQAEWLSWLHPDARSTAWKNQCLQLETA